MNAILMPIQPKFVDKITNGEKTIEVLKTKPKIKTPFKCYIYETTSKYKKGVGAFFYGIESQGTAKGRGKVIGEFVCDEIDEYAYSNIDGVDIDDDILLKTCLDREDINIYAKGKKLYGWHISGLEIYDTPKELSEFRNLQGQPIKRPFQSWGYVCTNE